MPSSLNTYYANQSDNGLFLNWVVVRVFNYNSYYSMLACANYGHRAGGLGNKEMARLGGWWFA